MNKFYFSLQNSKKIHKGNSIIVNRKECEQKMYNEKISNNNNNSTEK